MTQTDSGLHILIVENNASDSLALTKLLARSSATTRVTTVLDGDAALTVLRESREAGDPPGLVILDLGLVGRDGRDVLRTVKSDPRLKQVPVVVFTGSTRPSDVSRAYEYGANTFIRKPVDFEEFAHIVELIAEYWTRAAVLPSLEDLEVPA